MIDKQEAPQQETILECTGCKATLDLKAFFHKRDVDIEGEEGVTEIRLLCPECGLWKHAYYRSPHTRRLRASVERAQHLYNARRTQRALKAYRRAMTKHQKAFDELQIRLRQKTGESSPTEALGQMIIDVPKVDE